MKRFLFPAILAGGVALSSAGFAQSATLKSSGSGVVIGAREVLTNAHVVEKCTNIVVRASSVSAAYLVARDEENDLAVIRSNLTPSSVAVFRAGPVRAGDAVVALGYPLPGLLASTANLTTGIVSALAGLGDDSRYLQISAPVQPGNSGGPLLDAGGHLIGIVTAKLDALRAVRATGALPENVNFALKTAVVRTFLDSKGIGYQTARSEQQLSPADVGEIARPFTVQIDCTGDSPNNEDTTAPTPRPAPIPVKTLPACESPSVTNTLIRIGIINRIAVFNVAAHMLSGTTDTRYCTALVWTSVGKRIVNYTVTWTNRETSQFWVQVTWYSRPVW